MNLSIVTSVLFLILGSTSPAQDPVPVDGGDPPQVDISALPRDLLGLMDDDRDGRLSREELVAWKEILIALDENGDGRVDGADFEGLPPPPPEGFFPDPFGGPPPGPGVFGRTGARPGRQDLELVEQFDGDGDGKLDSDERAKARVFVKENRQQQGGPRGRRGGRRGGRGAGPGGEMPTPEPGPKVAIEDATTYPGHDLYDTSVLRTYFLNFDNDGWESELEDFYHTDVELPAKLTVDGEVYKGVGVSFRGNSSFFSVATGMKRSLGVSIDFTRGSQRLGGYKTLNLLNAHTDPSFLREVLFNAIARDYLPAPRANLVKVVINGESWGVYVNSQQTNKEFISQWYGSPRGTRWKVPPDMSGDAALVWLGPDIDSYRNSYEIKSKESASAWQGLIALCEALETMTDEQVVGELDGSFNIDGALWFLALDNVFGDGDGYFSRGSDYLIFQDPKHRRFHLFPHDSNETFHLSGGRGPGGRGRRGGDRGDRGGFDQRPTSTQRDIFLGSNDDRRPLTRRFFAIPELKARYVAHLHTIIDESLDWQKLAPTVTGLRDLIADEIAADTRKLTSTEAFEGSLESDEGGGGFRRVPGLRSFVEARRTFLLDHEWLKKPSPEITTVEVSWQKKQPVWTVTTADRTAVDRVILYFSNDRHASYRQVDLKASASGDSYIGGLPDDIDSDPIFYYVEARAPQETGTTVFFPARATAAPGRVSGADQGAVGRR